MRTSSSHEEGCHRLWSTLTKQVAGAGVRVTELHCVEVDWVRGERGWEMRERPRSEFTLKADLVLLAMGFLHVVHEGLIGELGPNLDNRGNIRVDRWMTSADGVFAAGDTVRGASLVVHAINEGRLVASAIDRWLKAKA
jgi:glutamate synthase (NADPH/NADH) small chain